MLQAQNRVFYECVHVELPHTGLNAWQTYGRRKRKAGNNKEEKGKKKKRRVGLKHKLIVFYTVQLSMY